MISQQSTPTWRNTSSETVLVAMLTLERLPNMEEQSLAEPPEQSLADTPSRWDSDPDTEDLQE